MKRFYIPALAFCAMTMTASGAVPFHKGVAPPRPSQQSTFPAHATRAAETTTILDEDFSRFTQGSEDVPGPQIEYVDRYHIPADMTSTPGWTGQGVFPCAGSIALLDRTDTSGKLGYISTPPMNLGGTATLTFRARTLPGTSGGSLWIAVCDPDYGPGDDEKDFILSEKWDTYTLVASEASLTSKNYFQFQAENGYVQIDDIKIDFKRDRLPVPQTLKPVNVSPTEFIARWQDVGVPKYRLNVLCKSEPEEVVKGVLSESFDGLNLNPGSNTINLSDPGYPEGWEIDLSSNGSQDVSTQAGTFNSAPLSLFFDAVGDVITSPATPEPIYNFKFWVRPSSMEENEEVLSLLRIEIYHSRTGKWENIAHLPYYWMTSDGAFYEFAPSALGDDATRVRMSMIQRGNIDFYVDDVTLSYSTGLVVTNFIKDLDVEATEYNVRDIAPRNEYIYYVQAVDGDLISNPSDETWVDGITGLKPQALEATEITKSSFTANWRPLGHATDYKVETSRITHANTDMNGVLVLEEDFNAIDSEGQDWISPYDFSEKGMASTAWCATQPIWKPGMAGTQGTSWIGAAGLVFSPRLDLSANDGKGFDVEATVVTTVASIPLEDETELPEGVFVMVLKSHTDSQALAFGYIETPEVGSHSAKVNVPNPDGVDLSDVIVAFMNVTGTEFYVDDVKITQDLKAGDVLRAPCAVTFTQETSARIDGLREGSDHAYSVTASAMRDYESYVSLPSDVVTVSTSTSAVRLPEHPASGVSVSTGPSSISVVAPEGTEILVIAADGMVKARSLSALSISATPGVYIVKAGSESFKVMVK